MVEKESSKPSIEVHPDLTDAPRFRKGEENKVRFRSSRVYQSDDAWYFSTREGINLGPYTTKHDAEREVALLVKMLAETTDETAAAILIHQFYRRPSSR